MEPDPRHPRYIKTVYGAGYCLELPSNGALKSDGKSQPVESSAASISSVKSKNQD